MHHFFLNPADIQADIVNFPADRSHQIVRVLRLHGGDQVVVLDNLGNAFLTELTLMVSSHCQGKIIRIEPVCNEPQLQLHLFVAITQREKLEWIFQKCTEIGVKSFTPVVTERSLTHEVAASQKKQERWQRIVMEAAEQSERGFIPVIHPPISLQESLAWEGENRLIAYEGEKRSSLVSSLHVTEKNVALLIGPEGGFSLTEVQEAIEKDWQPVSLGNRILRMETAAIVASTLVLDNYGEFSPTPSAR